MITSGSENQKRKMELKRSMFLPKAGYLKMIVSLGMASCINQIAMAIVQITMNNTLRYYGAQSMYGSEIPLACVGVISKVNMVFMAIAIGISQGCQPIWGFNYGAHNYDRVREAYKKAFAICIVLGVVFFGCFQLFPRQIVSISRSANIIATRAAAPSAIGPAYITPSIPMNNGKIRINGSRKMICLVRDTTIPSFDFPMDVKNPEDIG